MFSIFVCAIALLPVEVVRCTVETVTKSNSAESWTDIGESIAIEKLQEEISSKQAGVLFHERELERDLELVELLRGLTDGEEKNLASRKVFEETLAAHQRHQRDCEEALWRAKYELQVLREHFARALASAEVRAVGVDHKDLHSPQRQYDTVGMASVERHNGYSSNVISESERDEWSRSSSSSTSVASSDIEESYEQDSDFSSSLPEEDRYVLISHRGFGREDRIGFDDRVVPTRASLHGIDRNDSCSTIPSWRSTFTVQLAALARLFGISS